MLYWDGMKVQMNTLPLKIFYTLKEAATVLNERLKTTEINEDYFLHLGMRGDIRLGIFAKPDFSENDIGVLHSDWLDFDESAVIENLKTVDTIVKFLSEIGAILILYPISIKEISFYESIKLIDMYFDNVYSIDAQECAILGKYEDDYYCSKFFDKLKVTDFFEHVYYSEKHNVIHQVHIESGFLSFPQSEENDDWRVAFWFNDSFDFNQDMKQLQSERKISREDCLIRGEDLELLLNGKKRESVKKHLRKPSDQISKTELNAKLHPKRANSINQIIYGLAKMADLDLSQHQSAYTQFDAFCSQHGIEIPAKDTCGNLFKEAHSKNNF